jgi:hypothetical protein
MASESISTDIIMNINTVDDTEDKNRPISPGEINDTTADLSSIHSGIKFGIFFSIS